RAGGELVVDADRLVHRGHLVEAVRAHRTHAQVKIDLRGNPDLDRTHGAQPAELFVLPQRLGHEANAPLATRPTAVMDPPYRRRCGRRRWRRRTPRPGPPHGRSATHPPGSGS